MRRDQVPAGQARLVTPRALRLYAQARGWEKVDEVNGILSVYRRPEAKAQQLLLPLDDQLDDYADVVAEAVLRLAEFEKRPAREVLDHLLLPPSDLLRFRDQGVATRAAARGRDLYFELIRRFPLRPIRSEEDLDEATAILDELSDRLDSLTREEKDYLDILCEQVAKYEKEHHAIEAPSEAEALRYLLDARGVRQAQAAKEMGIAESTLSEVLAGKRKLTRAQVGKACAYFNVGPAVFGF
jgi:HTH-type transcriptional regulator / antitoxin HigA